MIFKLASPAGLVSPVCLYHLTREPLLIIIVYVDLEQQNTMQFYQHLIMSWYIAPGVGGVD